MKRLRHPGGGGNVLVAVGGVPGLGLQLAPSGGRTWILRVMVGSRRREMGLGGYPAVGLAEAREAAREARAAIRDGVDPVERRRAARAALIESQRPAMTFAQAMDLCLSSRLEGLRSGKHRAQWRATLEAHAIPVLGAIPIAEIGAADVVRALSPIWSTRTETATRLRARIEDVLAWATVSQHRAGDNPARWGGNLEFLLPRPSLVSKAGNQPAVALGDVAAWFAALQLREGIAARAVEFLALCAARSGEVRSARWSEIGADDVWTIPAQRMKGGREHRVPLSPAAVEMLAALPRFPGSDLLFTAPRGGMLSDMTLSAVMRRMQAAEVAAGRAGWCDPRSGRPAVPHGLRSTFRDWAAERTRYPREMAEIALSHQVGSEVERAYRRSDMMERRRAMMRAWAKFVMTPPAALPPTPPGRSRSTGRSRRSA